MQKLLTWLNQHGLEILVGALLLIVPLLPKLPLFDALPGYIVRVRMEDFLILIASLWWGVLLLKKKITLHPLMTKIAIGYIVVGFLSTLSAMFVTHTVPLVQIHIFKLYFHFFRRLEYFSLFFIMYSVVKDSPARLKRFIVLSVMVMLAVALYGFGQKYLYWPVYSTMNREFAKGWKLYLTEHARVPSTFGGHYDAAAYTVLLSTIAISILWFKQNKWLKLLALVVFLSSLWLLVLTASRTSSIAYIGAISFLGLFWLFVKGFWFPIPRYLSTLLVSVFIMISFGDLSERFSQIAFIKQFKEKYQTVLLSAKVDKPKDGKAVSEIELVTDKTDTPPTPVNQNNLPGDVYENIPLPMPETDAEGKYTGNFVNVSRSYSDNAYKYGLSAAIRLDALWPRAIAGFKKNPLLGSGYSTLTKEANDQFTEAESTDNDYLRNLGESGILGVGFFFALVVAPIIIALKNAKKVEDPLLKSFLVGFAAAACGLLVNAIYIDVFEASKVAETYWMLAAMAVAAAGFANTNNNQITNSKSSHKA